MARAAGNFTLIHALLTGGIDNGTDGKNIENGHPLNKFGYKIDYGFVASLVRFGASLIQTHVSALL